MTHQPIDDRHEPMGLTDIVAADELHPTIGRQLANGLGGLVLLLVTGVIVVLLVLWKAP